jgi:anti-sigma B factor antagonist
VTVATFLDSKILDEQNIQAVGEEMFRLVDEGGRLKIILNLVRVEYLSSAFHGKAITLQRKIDRAKGRLAFTHVNPQIYEVYEITKLDKFFRFYGEVSEALDELAGLVENERLLSCPVRGCTGTTRSMALREGQTVYLRCPECDARFQLVLPPLNAEGATEAGVTQVHLGSYEQESFTLHAGPPYRVEMAGRLDLFAGDALERLWRTIPLPRRVLLDGRRLTEVSPKASVHLAKLLRQDEDTQVVLLLLPDKPDLEQALPEGPTVFTDAKLALQALPDPAVEVYRPILTTVRAPG